MRVCDFHARNNSLTLLPRNQNYSNEYLLTYSTKYLLDIILIYIFCCASHILRQLISIAESVSWNVIVNLFHIKALCYHRSLSYEEGNEISQGVSYIDKSKSNAVYFALFLIIESQWQLKIDWCHLLLLEMHTHGNLVWEFAQKPDTGETWVQMRFKMDVCLR